MKKQPYICLYLNLIDQIAMLSQEEKGNLFDFILHYGNTGEVPEAKGNERFLFPGIKWQMDRDQEKYEEKCKKNKENRRKANKNDDETEVDDDQPSSTTVNDGQRSSTTVDDGDQEKEKEEEKENEKENEKEEEEEKKEIKKCAPPSPVKLTDTPSRDAKEKAKEVLELYQALCPSLKPVSMLTKNRENALSELFKTFELCDIEAAFVKAEKSSFLKGINPRRWVASFDFIIDSNNFAKLIDGNYDDAESEIFSDRTRNCGWSFEENSDTAETNCDTPTENADTMCNIHSFNTDTAQNTDTFTESPRKTADCHKSPTQTSQSNDFVTNRPNDAKNHGNSGNMHNLPTKPSQNSSTFTETHRKTAESHNFVPPTVQKPRFKVPPNAKQEAEEAYATSWAIIERELAEFNAKKSSQKD